MSKRVILIFLSTFCISMFTYGIDAWIRINQLGYLPNAKKYAVLLSEVPQTIKFFSIHDALTNQELGTFSSINSFGEYQSFKGTYILDFSSFKVQGAFYIQAGLVYSPTIYINKNVYLGSADFLLNYLRQQRYVYNSKPDTDRHQFDGLVFRGDESSKISVSENNTENSIPAKAIFKSSIKKNSQKKPFIESQEQVQPKHIEVKGGWHEDSNDIQYGNTTATAIYQMLFAYQMNPMSFVDKHDAGGKEIPNGIPDILDEAKWGLDWLLKMYPGNEVLYHQIGDDRDHISTRLPKNKGNYSLTPGKSLPIYLATGKPQGASNVKNHSTGLASIAGKYSSAFGLGSELLKKFYPLFADTLSKKAAEAYLYGQKYPGVCQSVPADSPVFQEEENWADDMELAAAQLYRLTYEGHYLKEAADYGRMEPVTPWMCSDTARNYQWYPFINLGHSMLASVENPRYRKEFLEDMLNGIQRMNQRSSDTPFKVAVPFIRCSNNLVIALATQCRLYRNMTGDSTYLGLETALIDWLFGCNPWGTCMIIGLPKIGISDPYSALRHIKRIAALGGVVNGPVGQSTFKNPPGVHLSKDDRLEQFQTDLAVYHDDSADSLTNEPTLDGTASLTYLLSGKQLDGVPDKTADNNQYTCGGITRTDSNKKQISLVFTGTEYNDGYKTIRKTLKKLNIKASFFFTGDFYRNGKNKGIIKGLLEDQHYLGAHSDKNLLYCSWQKRDSMLINKTQFLNDLKANYSVMEKFGVSKSQTPFYLPPFAWYNDSISRWCKEIGIQLVSNTPGTLSNADNSIPEMRDKYFSSNEIQNKILQVESKQGLNGHIMLFHMGTDSKRNDKFYPRLYSLLLQLSKVGYDFVDLYRATDAVDKNLIETGKKQKRKN